MTGSAETTERVDTRSWRGALLVTAGALAIRLAYAALLPLFPDETYYWDWSRHLAGGYFDHPPMIALLIGGGTTLSRLLGAGPTPFAVRLLPVLAGAFASLAAIGIARRLAGDAAAWTAAIVFALMPLAATGLVLATPDAPLLAFSAAALYGVVRALQSPPRSRTSLWWWSLAGVALGLAFASKYTSILLPLTVVAAVVARPSLRTRLRELGPYVACVLATIVFLPVLRWNAAHDWISFRFQIQHGLGSPTGSALKRELDLIGGQLGLVSPILFALMAVAVWRALRRTRDDARFALAAIAVGSWVFFAYSALRRSVEANWPAPSYVPGVALLASEARRIATDTWLRRGIALAALLVAVLYVQALVPVLPLPARRDPIARSAGWDALAARVDEVRGNASDRHPESRTWLGAERYQDVSELAYHAAGHPQVFCTCLAGRHNQYELWPGFPDRAALGDTLVLALDERTGMHEAVAQLEPHFDRVTRGALAALTRRGDTVTVRRVWVLAGYRGGWPVRRAP